MEWEVHRNPGVAATTRVVRVFADTWTVGENGDLVFLDTDRLDGSIPVRAFAAGTWEEVELWS